VLIRQHLLTCWPRKFGSQKWRTWPTCLIGGVCGHRLMTWKISLLPHAIKCPRCPLYLGCKKTFIEFTENLIWRFSTCEYKCNLPHEFNLFVNYTIIKILDFYHKLTLIHNKMPTIHYWYIQIKLNGTWLQYCLETIKHYLETLTDHPKLANI
jgi:hypothetical protein